MVGLRTSALILAAIIGCGLSWSPAAALEPDDAALSDAIRFRTEFGLDTSPQMIRSLLASPAEDDAFGTPLAPDELLLMRKRSELSAQMDRLLDYRDSHPASWGGVWLTYPRNAPHATILTVNVGVTSDTAPLEAELRSLVPSDADLVLHRVQRTEAELNAVTEEIARSKDFFESRGIDYHAAGPVLQRNLVQVYVSHTSAELLTAANERFRGMVELVEAGPVVPDACIRTNCGPPWRGGIKIYPSGPLYCSTGFIVRRLLLSGWQYAIWTAGHCADATWREGSSSGTVIGSTSVQYFTDGGDVDVQVIPISAANATNDYIHGTSNCGPDCPLKNIFYSQGQNADIVGDVVCQHGAISGTKCGTLVQTNFTFDWEEENVSLLRIRRATYTRQGGDSGGPVTRSETTAAGTHTHWEEIDNVIYAVYSHVWEMEQATGYLVYKLN